MSPPAVLRETIGHSDVTQPRPGVVRTGPGFHDVEGAADVAELNAADVTLVTSSYTPPPPVSFRDASTLPASRKLPGLLPPRRTSMMPPQTPPPLTTRRKRFVALAPLSRPMSAINTIDHGAVQ